MNHIRKKVIVAECSLPLWIDVIKKLGEEIGWDPVYWTAHSSHLDFKKIKQTFSNVVVQENYDAVRGIAANEFSMADVSPVDSELIKRFSYHESIVLTMMDRMDPLRIFSHADRVRLFHFYLRYWSHILDVLQPDIYFSPVTPHLCYDYILFELCKFKKIPCVIFIETALPFTILVADDFKFSPNSLTYQYESLLKSGNEPVLSPSAEAYLSKVKSHYKEGMPRYMMDQIETSGKRLNKSKFEKLLSSLRAVASNLKHGYLAKNGNPVHVYYKAKDGTIDTQIFSESERVLYNRAMAKRTSRLKKKYEGITSEVSFEKPYLFVALMYQPERTSCPEGDIFVCQYLMVEWLSHVAPEGWTIYVKEHPSQFMFPVDQTRNEWFYDDLLKLPNVKFVSVQTDTFKLIDHCKATATLTGTVGFEAIVRSKPVLTFGYAWYRICEGSLAVNNMAELKDHMVRIQSGYIPEEKKVKRFVQALEETGANGYVDPYYQPGMEYQENIRNLTRAIMDFMGGNSSTQDKVRKVPNHILEK